MVKIEQNGYYLVQILNPPYKPNHTVKFKAVAYWERLSDIDMGSMSLAICQSHEAEFILQKWEFDDGITILENCEFLKYDYVLPHLKKMKGSTIPIEPTT